MVAALAAPPLPLACVVHTGDLAERGDTQDLARTELSKLQLPLHVLPGNHDMMEADSAEGFVRRWGALSSSAEYQGVVFLMVYDHPTQDYDPLAWLEQALVQAGDKPVIVFHHEPPVDDFYENALHPGWAADRRERWRALLEAHHVLATVAGHFHRDELHYLGRVPLLVSAPGVGPLRPPSVLPDLRVRLRAPDLPDLVPRARVEQASREAGLAASRRSLPPSRPQRDRPQHHRAGQRTSSGRAPAPRVVDLR